MVTKQGKRNETEKWEAYNIIQSHIAQRFQLGKKQTMGNIEFLQCSWP